MNVGIRLWQIEDSKSLADALNNKKIHDNLRDGLPSGYTVFHSFRWNKRAQNGRIEWGEADFKGALTAPTTGVYFLFMELKDPDGNVVSYNSYALPMKREPPLTGASK